MEHLKPYHGLKASGEMRIGKIPTHWDTEPLWAIAKPKSIKNQHDRELLSVYLNLGVVPFESVKEKRTNATSEDLSSYQAVEPGDFVLNNQQAWRGSVGVSMHKGIVSPAYLVLSLGPRINPRYANLLLRDRSMVAQYLIASKGVGSIQRNLYWPHLKRIPIILPPLPEQAAIVRFLDHADRKIRRYIRAKQKLIKLLEEQKQVIINRAVTRGLDPNVPLKPSGVEWVGEVPDHWQVVRSRRIFTARKDFALPGDVQLSATQAYGVIPQEEYERQVGRRVVKISMHLEKRKHVELGDFVMSMRSFQGGLERAWSAGAIRSSYVVIKPSNAVDTDFFTYLFKSRGYIGALQATADFIRDGQDLTEANFRGVDLPLPPRSEQALIAAYIGKATKRSVHEASRLESEIVLLREYRTRLIADVVTGKLDVREAAALLLDEDQELPTIDELDDISEPEEDDFDDLDEGTEDPES